ncbi:MAG: bifunctional 23S rRNA (guanine(2069)-N(7))-methyltransferase RlmK/23S rRNA (guanine(2445)-N(2))-methyltransferase RlmL [Pirellulaceae bacterium]
MNLIAACAFGLEALVKRELIALGYDPQVTQPGRIQFQGDWPDICRANLWLRTADRVLIQALQFEAADFDALFDTVRDHDWSWLLSTESAFPVTGRSRRSGLTSVPAIQRSVKRAIVESLKRSCDTNELPETGPTCRIDVALLDDTATLTVDTTGNSLHKRGYRKLAGPAPIKETLAAALVDLSVWNPERVLVDPFCGTGTIPIEAALIGMNIAPGLQRSFSSCEWPQITQDQWNEARAHAQAQSRNDVELQISGTDIDAASLELARFHARKAGVEHQIHFQQKAFADFRSKRDYGVIVTNPPYGERLQDQERLEALYTTFPAVFARVPTWSFFFITNMPRIESTLQRKADRRRKLFNGRIECTYFQFLGPRPPSRSGDDVVSNKPDVGNKPDNSANAVFGGLQDKDQEQAELFRNRLAKRARHLRRWPARRGITCFRIYDRDIPEIPLVVDRYEDHLHITEYERPHERDLARHAQWLELMTRTAATTLDVPIQKTHLKSRDRKLGQYEKVDHKRKMVPVNEGGLRFLINLNDYVDTGLFLDHRQTRDMVRQEAEGKRFLNLFGYTGSFTVYAASGGATTTTTVDLSKNYLDWARKNLQSNDLDGPDHQFVMADSIEFLKQARARGEHYDLCVVDPPTYSNSKQTDRDWDIQDHHLELLKLIADVMSPGGVVYFSSNFRRFKFDEDSLANIATIREISKQTVPEDFRNQRIHRCWRLVFNNTG